mmetsp:Transcript_10864/g.24251  ORF Transcript_10864/g.24251 Transcript_10864/m.24251 type:complete len:217 (+) Transcript_10864:192-842(+)
MLLDKALDIGRGALDVMGREVAMLKVAFFSAFVTSPDNGSTSVASWSGVGCADMRPSMPQDPGLPPNSPKVALRGPEPKSPACGLPNDLKLFNLAAVQFPAVLLFFFGDGTLVSLLLRTGISPGVFHLTDLVFLMPSADAPGEADCSLFPCKILFNRKADFVAFFSPGDLSACAGLFDRSRALRKLAKLLEALNNVEGRAGFSSVLVSSWGCGGCN